MTLNVTRSLPCRRQHRLHRLWRAADAYRFAVTPVVVAFPCADRILLHEHELKGMDRSTFEEIQTAMIVQYLRYVPTFLLMLGPILASGQRVLPLGSGTTAMLSGIEALAIYQDELIIGGSFTMILGHQRNNLQSWDGAQHGDLGDAFSALASRVRDLRVFNGQLVVAGTEPTYGNIAQWNGSAWSAMAQGISAQVNTLVEFEGELFAGTQDGRVHRWNGTVWSPVGSVLGGPVLTLEVYQGQLYVGGSFTEASSGLPWVNGIAILNGSDWASVGPGVNGTVNTLRSDPLGLLVGGDFTATQDLSQNLPYWTVWDGSYSAYADFPRSTSVHGFHRLPDGRLLVSGNFETLVMDGDAAIGSFRFAQIRGCVEYDDKLIVAGGSSMSLGHQLTNGIGRLVEGTLVADLDLNSIRANISPIPGAFADHHSYWPGFEVPKGLGAHTIYTAIPWIIATANGDELGYTPSNFSPQNTGGGRFPWAGPLANSMDDPFYERYHRVWKLDRAMVQNHIAHWQDPGYVLPEAIASWPGNGDAPNGEPHLLAPFMDVDGDGMYDPLQGDYPVIRGDQAVYAIMHAHAGPQWDGTELAELDIHAMYHTYHPSTVPALDGAVFVNYRIINRSSVAYEQVRFGMLFDPQIGCNSDDLVGCDSTRSVIYAYNGTDTDIGCVGAVGYGPTPPAQGVVFLNEALRSHRVVTPNAPLTDLMYGLVNGQPINFNGSPTNFMYPGGTYMDQLAPAMPGRVSIGATGPFTVEPLDTLCIDLAFVYARATSGGALASREALLVRVDTVREFYATSGLVCTEEPIMLGVPQAERNLDVRLFPNPASQGFHINSTEAVQRVALFDLQGRLVHSVSTIADQVFISTSDLARGSYLVQVSLKSGSRTMRVVLE